MKPTTLILRLTVLAALLPGLTPALSAAVGDDEQVLRTVSTRPARDAAIERGLAWLRRQMRPDGTFAEGQHQGALSALALMAHFAAGVTGTDREHGGLIRRGLARFLEFQDPKGYFGAADDSRMYGHGIATLLLSEVVGMNGDPALDERLRAALERAVALTLAAARIRKDARHRGGWRYHPHDRDSDLSLSGWQLLGLRSAQAIGVTVDEAVVRAAATYVRSCISAQGLVCYQPGDREAPALRGLALLAMASTGTADATITTAIVRRLRADPIAWGQPFFYYRCYYDAVGVSRADPEAWGAYRTTIENALLPRQQTDGSWPQGEAGPVYATSMAVLALAVERYLLPAYQR